jgi:hypothetical protein
LFSDVGFRIGLVTPSSVAASRLFVDGENQTSGKLGLTLVVKVAGSTVSVLLTQHGRLRLVRSLDLTPGDEALEPSLSDALLADSLVSIVQQTLAYAEDQIGAQVTRILVCGTGNGPDGTAVLAQREFGIPAVPVRSRFGLALPENAGLLGLLEQYSS